MRKEKDSALGTILHILACHIRHYQEPEKPEQDWRCHLLLAKYDICNDTNKVPQKDQPPKQQMVFGLASFTTIFTTANQYVSKVWTRLNRNNISLREDVRN